ncbi:MAG TPA: mechanosensitive ion channel family protein [Terriglobales bacterium]|jgi:small-conductance mechanosensitive channel
MFEIVAMVLGAWLFRVLVIGQLRRLSRQTKSQVDDELIAILNQAIKPVLVLAIIAASLNLFPLPVKLVHVANRIVTICVIALLLYYVSRVLQLFLNSWLNRRVERESLREPIRFVSHVVFAVFAVMILLDNLGISLTAVWTTLGLGSVAVALALQDTLSNFFAGVYLRLDNPVRVGDYIRLESGEEGFVIEQGWRSARIRTLPNNVVVVPNAKLASTIVTNYSLPEPQMSLLISVGVSYQSDPDQVERILVEEVTNASGQIEGLVATPPPFVRFIPGFGDSSLNFTLICRVASFVDQYLVQHELRKRIFARFRQEGITIPFPQRDVHIYEARASGWTPTEAFHGATH